LNENLIFDKKWTCLVVAPSPSITKFEGGIAKLYEATTEAINWLKI